eukprot:CAMPEP_0170186976 /NCGR_PEP_ID=MMETSP0040_2-20121228/40611_1 /TAXON_ID=641309 /ORGANISM="Lotharella oceanica, Strain CCMP622" /LENGTH=142 /DNA_ID=CAMNT_0010433875 /DNA_START=121 /DNA_END=546 /DNA_ORIENTATION=+
MTAADAASWSINPSATALPTRDISSPRKRSYLARNSNSCSSVNWYTRTFWEEPASACFAGPLAWSRAALASRATAPAPAAAALGVFEGLAAVGAAAPEGGLVSTRRLAGLLACLLVVSEVALDATLRGEGWDFAAAAAGGGG